MSALELPESVIVCTPTKVVVRLHRAPFRRRPWRVAFAAGLLVSAVFLLLAVVLESYLSKAEIGLLWLLALVVVARNLFFDRTLVAVSPPGGAWLESRSVIRGIARRKPLCRPGEARSIGVHSRVDLESDIRPYELHEVHAATGSRRVFLCSFEDKGAAMEVGKALAQVLGCEWQAA